VGVIERLTLRPFQADDLPEFVAYRSDPEVARYQLWDGTYSLADAERFLSSQQGVAFGRPRAWWQLAAVDPWTGRNGPAWTVAQGLASVSFAVSPRPSPENPTAELVSVLCPLQRLL